MTDHPVDQTRAQVDAIAEGIAANAKAIRRLTVTFVVALVLSVIVLGAVLAGGRLLIEQRQHNCEQVIEAFDAYTAALAKVTDAPGTVETELRGRYEPELADCN